jgi:hypothetical protein
MNPGRPLSGARSVAIALVAVPALVVAACGSSTGGTPGPASSAAPGSSVTATPAVQATPDTGGGGGGTGGGGGGTGGGANPDVEAVANALVPPHSTEITKTTATDTWFVMYESTDSVDTLKAFYERAIPNAGLQIFSTSTVQGGVSWVIATDASASFGGAVNVFPTGDGKTSVQVTIGKT